MSEQNDLRFRVPTFFIARCGSHKVQHLEKVFVCIVFQSSFHSSFSQTSTLLAGFGMIITTTAIVLLTGSTRFHRLESLQVAPSALASSFNELHPLSDSIRSIYLLPLTCCPTIHSITSLFYQAVIKVDLIKRQEKKLIYICIQSIAIH